MKTIRIFPITLAVLLCSCEAFLTEEPKSNFSEGNYYTDVESLKGGSTGAYSVMRNMYAVSSGTPLFISLLGTDEVLYRGTSNVRTIIDRYTYTSTDACVKQHWKLYYKLVATCNTVIHKGSGMTDGTESQRSYYIGQARFLRAWAYFNLVQTYGAVPLMKDFVTEFDYSVGRSPVKDVYGLIVDDLLYCVPDGVLKRVQDGGWATQWAAKTLLGKVYLTMASAKAAGRVEGYQDLQQTPAELYGLALGQLRDVRDHSDRSLEPVYGDIFSISKRNTNKETIWELQYSAEIPYGSQWSKEFGAMASNYDSQQLTGGWRSNGLAGNCSLNFVPSLRNYYNKHGTDETYDVRRTWNLSDSIIMFDRPTNKPASSRAITATSGSPQPGSNTTQNTINYSGIIKYRWTEQTEQPWKYEHDFTYSNCPNNIIVLRFADVLLMIAEADLGANGAPTQEGLDAVNAVVQRARGLDADGNPVTADQTPGFDDYTGYGIEELLYERARELCFERWRWYDLARTGKFEEFLAERNASSLTKTGFDVTKHYVFPVPLDEIQLSTNKEKLYQNPNY